MKLIKSLILSTYQWALAMGVNLKTSLYFIPGLWATLIDYLEIKRQARKKNISLPISFNFPCLNDRYNSSGYVRGHYFFQDLFVAQKLFEHNPSKHLDIASRIDGFVAHVATFRKIEVMDIRPLPYKIKNIDFIQHDLFNLDKSLYGTFESISCLHALEHFGLGRYRDKIDIEGCLKGFEILTKLVAPNGILYFSVPIGPNRIDFNAHRVFSIKTLFDLMRDKFEVLNFAYIDDQADMLYEKSLPLKKSDIDKNFNCQTGCGIFVLRKAVIHE